MTSRRSKVRRRQESDSRSRGAGAGAAWGIHSGDRHHAHITPSPPPSPAHNPRTPRAPPRPSASPPHLLRSAATPARPPTRAAHPPHAARSAAHLPAPGPRSAPAQAPTRAAGRAGCQRLPVPHGSGRPLRGLGRSADSGGGSARPGASRRTWVRPVRPFRVPRPGSWRWNPRRAPGRVLAANGAPRASGVTPDGSLSISYRS